MIYFLRQKSVIGVTTTYGKRKSVYAKWKTNFTFTQTTVYMKLILVIITFISLSVSAQDSLSDHYKIYDTRSKTGYNN